MSLAHNEKLIQSLGLMESNISAHLALGCRSERSHCTLLYGDVPDSNPKREVGNSPGRLKTIVLVNLLLQIYSLDPRASKYLLSCYFSRCDHGDLKTESS